MGWQEELRPGSFRGVPFKTSSSGADFGIRKVTHEYPLRNTPYGEPMGRKAREFSIEAYVIGDDYLRQRDALIEACEVSDRGELVHPYYGTRWVLCDGCKISETNTEGRMARISLTFSEAGERKFPAAKGNFASRLGSAGDGLFSTVSNSFSKVYSVAKLPQQFVDRAVDQIRAVSDSLNQIKGIGDTVASYVYTAKKLSADAILLATKPVDLASRIISSVSMISDLRFNYGQISSAYRLLFGSTKGKNSPAVISETISLPAKDPVGVVSGASSLFTFGDPASEAFTPSPLIRGSTIMRQQEQKNTDAIIDLVKCSAIAVAAVAAAQIEYPSYQDALSVRANILTQIDYQFERTTDDQVYQALQDVRTNLVQAVPGPDKDLPMIIEVENKQTRPSLVIVYSLYDNLNLETDLIARNRIEHPGFVRGGISLETISK